jgi:hypothetical protein
MKALCKMSNKANFADLKQVNLPALKGGAF